MNTRQNNIKEELVKCSEDSPMREVCGFICCDSSGMWFEEAINHSSDDDQFTIKPIDFLCKKMEGNLLAIFHSHVQGDEKPSNQDIISSRNAMIPFVIFSTETEKFFLFNHKDFEVDENSVNQLRKALEIND